MFIFIALILLAVVAVDTYEQNMWAKRDKELAFPAVQEHSS